MLYHITIGEIPYTKKIKNKVIKVRELSSDMQVFDAYCEGLNYATKLFQSIIRS